MAQKKIRSEKQNLLLRLRRLEGQLNGITRMVQHDAYCIDVLTQIAAARAALLALGKLILRDHMRSCLVDSFKLGRPEQAISELESVLAQLVK